METKSEKVTIKFLVCGRPHLWIWICWVSVAACGLLSRYSAWACRCGGFSRYGASLAVALRFSSCGTRAVERVGSVAVAHRLSCLEACGIFPDRGSNRCPLHWQVDSEPQDHQESPENFSHINHVGVVPSAFYVLVSLSVHPVNCMLLEGSTVSQSSSILQCLDGSLRMVGT